MRNADMPAMPQANQEVVEAFLEHEHDAPNGLTKREHFAAMAMQGFCAAPDMPDATVEGVAGASVKQADALLAELERTS